ncbi:hypothetical protein F2Q70_00027281 [Brassica cretica]|uniref:Uncharacterized protein n=1 Tax=Brassica cretica TaxID=69181 RepID=A0A3N6U7Z3_BRACR|nr:hypothetical protein F2Q70_00027281 [Brassica cretica]
MKSKDTGNVKILDRRRFASATSSGNHVVLKIEYAVKSTTRLLRARSQNLKRRCNL